MMIGNWLSIHCLSKKINKKLTYDFDLSSGYGGPVSVLCCALVHSTVLFNLCSSDSQDIRNNIYFPWNRKKQLTVLIPREGRFGSPQCLTPQGHLTVLIHHQVPQGIQKVGLG